MPDFIRYCETTYESGWWCTENRRDMIPQLIRMTSIIRKSIRAHHFWFQSMPPTGLGQPAADRNYATSGPTSSKRASSDRALFHYPCFINGIIIVWSKLHKSHPVWKNLFKSIHCLANSPAMTLNTHCLFGLGKCQPGKRNGLLF